MRKPEMVMHAKCYQWFHNTFHDERQMLFHVDNNSWNAIIGAQKKAMGVASGVSDFVFVDHGSVAFIELKEPGNSQLPLQREFEQKVKERGHEYIVIYNFTDFKNYICKRIGKSYLREEI